MSDQLKKIEVIDKQGKTVDSVELDLTGFDKAKAEKFVSGVIQMYLANQKKRTAKVKSRSEVCLTNRKPFKQKGTGRARAGSARSPIWVGGGVAFGPKPRDVKYEIPKKIRQRAIKDAFKIKVFNDQVVVIDDLGISESKTKVAMELFKGIGLSGSKLSVLTENSDKNVYLAVRNIPKAQVVSTHNVNALDMVNGGTLVLTKEAFDGLAKRLVA